jgi:hypothetical protein
MTIRMFTAARGRRLVALLACAALVVAFAVVLPDVAARLTGSNAVPGKTAIAKLAPGQRACQRGETLPAGTASLSLGAQTAARRSPTGSALRVTVTDPQGSVVTRGRVAAGYEDVAAVGIQLAPVRAAVQSVTVCVRNDGPVAMELLGSPTARPAPLYVQGHQVSALLALVWYGKPESWLSHVSTIAHHADTGGTQVAGGLTLWLALALVLMAGAAALVVTLREGDR